MNPLNPEEGFIETPPEQLRLNHAISELDRNRERFFTAASMCSGQLSDQTYDSYVESWGNFHNALQGTCLAVVQDTDIQRKEKVYLITNILINEVQERSRCFNGLMQEEKCGLGTKDHQVISDEIANALDMPLDDPNKVVVKIMESYIADLAKDLETFEKFAGSAHVARKKSIISRLINAAEKGSTFFMDSTFASSALSALYKHLKRR